MRFFEFQDSNAGIDKFVIALKNHIGRSASKKVPANLNWNAIASMSRSNGFEFATDYETFKAMYDSNPVLQSLVKNFNDRGIELNVPGAPEDNNPPGTQDSGDEVEKIADANAAKQLAQNQQGIKV